jgi:alkylated DNA repair dioxygenase AlkB/SAM-dependent methyltransferase
VSEYDSSGMGVEVFVHHKKMNWCCHVGMRSHADAVAIIAALQDKTVEWKWTDELGETHLVKSGRLLIDYALTQWTAARIQACCAGEPLSKREPSRSECTSTTEHVVIPGLVLIPEYVNQQEEAALVAVLAGPHAPWAPSQSTRSPGAVIKRRVQHFGYVFDYKTSDVLRDRQVHGADCPPLPKIASHYKGATLEDHVVECLAQGRGWEVLAGVVERVRSHRFQTDDGSVIQFPNINQLTVNHYVPGEGIGSHVDTPSAFGDGLMSLSLSGGIVMEFRKVGLSGQDKERKLVYLPPRSLLVMSGDARYSWEHMIVTRMTDTHNDQILPRQLRVSLTLRTALDLDGSVMRLVDSSVFPPVWGQQVQSSPLKTPDCERDHVHAVYDAIATQWHNTRGKRGVLWPGATQFLQALPLGSVVADVGCGDGKYFPAIWGAGSYVIGTDISLPLLETTKLNESNKNGVPESRRVSQLRQHLRNRPAVAVADCMNLPLRTKSFDAAICIAVMHHLSTENRRKRCIEELSRIVTPGGLINVQAWAMEQEEGSRRTFASSDVFVPFNAQPKHLKLNSVEESGRASYHDDAEGVHNSRSAAAVYSKALNADYDDQKGLVVFKRYCHLYRKGELEDIATSIPSVELVDSGFESGNYFMILKVLK